MVCYAIPTVGAVVLYLFRRTKTSLKENVYYYWLNILLLGGAIFGVVAHLWNGELFLVGENALMDIALGIAITITMFIAWAVIVIVDKTKTVQPKKTIQ